MNHGSLVVFKDPLIQPALRQVLAITNSSTPSVTTAQNHLYVSGTIVRFNIPTNYQGPSYGMGQLGQQTSQITVTGPTTFTLNDIDTTTYDPFVIPSNPTQYAQVIPIGENNNTLAAATHNIYG